MASGDGADCSAWRIGGYFGRCPRAADSGLWCFGAAPKCRWQTKIPAALCMESQAFRSVLQVDLELIFELSQV